MSRTIPAVGYVSTSAVKQDTSISEQQSAIECCAAQKGYEILRWYSDFNQMIADAVSKNDFRAILVEDVSRFGRLSPHEANHWAAWLAKADIQLVATGPGVSAGRGL